MTRIGKLATIALILALGTSTAVMAADDGETIKACADKRTGALRIVKDKKDCRKTEQFLRWNEQGPRGPQGPEGPRGPRGSGGGGGGGPAGPPGPDLGNYISASLRNCPIVVVPGQSIPFSSIDVANGIAVLGTTTFQLSTSGVYRITYNTGAVTSTPTQGELAIERNDVILAASRAATDSGVLGQEFLATFTAGDTIRLVSTATDPFTLNGSVCATVTMQLIDPA